MPPAQTRVKAAANPQPPYPYEVFEVSYENKADNVKIAGTLTQPKGAGPFPVALFVQGGPPASARDGADPGGAGRKPTLVIADYFARHGVALLRVDDRGVGGSTGNKMQSTIEQLASDAVAGVEFLKSRPALDPRRIALLGRSFGAVIVPLAAARSRDVAMVISLTGPAASFAEVSAPVGTGPGAQAAIFRVLQRLALENVPTSGLVNRAQELIAADPSIPENLRSAAAKGLPPSLAEQMAPLFVSYAGLEPGLGLSNVRVPLLAIYASEDRNVSPITNPPAMLRYLQLGRNPDFQIHMVPGLDHSLVSCTKPVPAGGTCEEEEVSPKVLKLMSDWILSH